MATALKLKSDIKKLKSAIASKATPKTFIPKLKTQLDKAESELSAISSGAKPRKTSTTKSTKTTLTALQKLIQKKKYGVYKGAGVNLEKDASEGAFASGRRVSKGLKSNQFGDKGDNKGNVYYEYRPNRLDVKQPKKAQRYPKLEKGGKLSGKYRIIPYKIIEVKGSPNLLEPYYSLAFTIEGSLSEANEAAQKYVKINESIITATVTKIHPSGQPLKNKKVSYVTKDEILKYEDGGMMAKGGEVVPYIIWVSKDGDKRELYGEYISMRAANMKMNKLWESGEYKLIGNMPKSKYEKEGFYKDGGMMAKGGNVTPKEKMIKELQKLQRDLNSSRLSQYREGDTSEEEMARQRERASKLARFNEILEVLNEDDKKMADGGEIEDKFKGKNSKEIWNNLDSSTKAKVLEHLFLKGNTSGVQYYDSYNSLNELSYSDWDKLPKNIKNEIDNFGQKDKMASGGYMADEGGNEDLSKVDSVLWKNIENNRYNVSALIIKYDKDTELRLLVIENGILLSNWINTKYFEKQPFSEGMYPRKKFNKQKIREEVINLLKENNLDSIKKEGLNSSSLKYLKKYAVGGYMAKGGSVNYGRSWTADRAKHNKSEDYEIPMKQRKFDHGGEVGQGFLIKDMREKLNRMFPDTFGFTVGNVSKEGNKTLNSAALIVDSNDPYRGLEDKDIQSKLFFPQYKRDHNINFRVMQGGENTYFYFALESEKGDEYIGQFGFKDQGDVSSDYITLFIAFLMEQYGLPFEVKHSVMAKGGYMASGGEMHKADYFKDGGKVFSEKELKEILDEALSHFYQGLNKLDTAMRYLEVKGQGGLRKPLSDKLKLDGLKESIEKIDEYISK
jgi:hypothetical protein